jgi:FdrA protein
MDDRRSAGAGGGRDGPPARASMSSGPPHDAGDLLKAPLGVVNVGLEGFADELARQGVAVVHVNWSPPAGGDPRLAGLLAKLAD